MSLKPFIEQRNADRSPVHRCKHLDVTDRIQMVASWQTALNEIKDELLRTQRIFFRHKKEIAGGLTFCIR